MDSSWDTIIVGAGIAGAFAATYCARRGRTLVIESDRPAAGASGAAAGLVNPFMGRRARPIWQWKEALEGLTKTLERGRAAEYFSRSGIVRIPRNSSQAETYRTRSREFSEVTEWRSPEAVKAQYPALDTAHGALFIDVGGFVHVPQTVRQLLTTAEARGVHVLAPATVTSWASDSRGTYVTVDYHTRLYADRVILAPGAGYQAFDQLETLELSGVKGQTVTVDRPPELGNLPTTSGCGYVVAAGNRLILGSTYEHEFSDADPSREQSHAIMDNVSKMIPGIAGAAIVEERAGIRVMTPPTNKAMIGPLPGHEDVWFFGGLGSKGLLMGGLMASHLLEWFDAPETIPMVLRPDSTRITQ